MMKRVLAYCAVLLLAYSVAASAQTVMNPRFNNVQIQSTAFAGLASITVPTQTAPDTGTRFAYCKDCVIASTCAGSGNGAWAWYNLSTSTWNCAGSLPTNLVLLGNAVTGDVTGDLLGPLNVGKWDGIALDSSMTAPANGSVPQYSNSSNTWIAQALQTNNTGIQAGTLSYTGGNLAVTHASAVSVLTQALTMPASGCPCRVLVNWNIAGTDAASLQLGGWINDGSATYAGGQGNTGALHGGISVGGVSSVTYANNATFTLTLFAQTDTGTFTIKTTGAISANIPSYLSWMVFSSN